MRKTASVVFLLLMAAIIASCFARCSSKLKVRHEVKIDSAAVVTKTTTIDSSRLQKKTTTAVKVKEEKKAETVTINFVPDTPRVNDYEAAPAAPRDSIIIAGKKIVTGRKIKSLTIRNENGTKTVAIAKIAESDSGTHHSRDTGSSAVQVSKKETQQVKEKKNTGGFWWWLIIVAVGSFVIYRIYKR